MAVVQDQVCHPAPPVHSSVPHPFRRAYNSRAKLAPQVPVALIEGITEHVGYVDPAVTGIQIAYRDSNRLFAGSSAPV
jgi:hypothetical protein